MLRSTEGLEQLGLSLQNLPLLPKGVGVGHERLAVAAQHGSGSIVVAHEPLTTGEMGAIVGDTCNVNELDRYHVLEGAHADLEAIGHGDVVEVCELTRGHAIAGRNNGIYGVEGDRQFGTGNTIDNIFAPRTDLYNVVTKLDSCSFDVGVIIASRGPNVGSKSMTVSKVGSC